MLFPLPFRFSSIILNKRISAYTAKLVAFSSVISILVLYDIAFIDNFG